jgi:hypothetical protein
LNGANGEITNLNVQLAQAQEQHGDLSSEISTLNGLVLKCNAELSQSQE